MTKLNLTDNMLASILDEIAPLVTSLTGWDLDLPSLRSRVLAKNQGYEEILIGRFEQLGITGYSDLLPDLIERLVEYMVEANFLAAYMPGKGEILVIRENVDDSNLDGLKLILGHELVHRGQHLTHGDLFQRVDHSILAVFQEIQYQTFDNQRIQSAFEQIQPIMTLLESHASYIQELLHQNYFPNAQIEKPFNLAVLLMHLVGAPKIAQYSDGLPQIQAAYAAGNIDLLYRSL